MDTITKRDATNGQNTATDLTGRRNGSLTAYAPTDRKDKNGYIIWTGFCDCGKPVEYPSYQFVRPSKRPGFPTCGCGPKGRPRIPESGAHINHIYATYEKSAKARGLAFYLTKDEVRGLCTKPCFYCGREPQNDRTHTNLSGVFVWNGIDRTNSKRGYELGNCVPCCSRCNWAKGTLETYEFIQMCQQIAARFVPVPL